MAALRTRSRAVSSPLGNSDDYQTHTVETEKMSVYEQSREQRIRENLDRMQKLGIMDLSLKLKSHTKRTRLRPSDCKTSHSPRPSSAKPSGPLRRSSRLQSGTPISYSEELPKNDESLENGKTVTERDSKPEIYTEEHEKLLGNTEKSWTLFVDGYGKDGKRIYDSFRGKTCHQCRQKTMGYRTQCSQCNMVQGQFCGDCLYMRYGEHVLEALQNPDWICPVCRGICNCSLCRQAKGWAPTGYLYRKVEKLGYKSVAHYLIQTRRSDPNAEKNDDASSPVSAERSLVPFTDSKSFSKESVGVNENDLAGSLKPLAEGDGGQLLVKRSLPFSDVQDQHDNENCLDTMKHIYEGYGGHVSAKRSLPFSDVQNQPEQIDSSETKKSSACSSKPGEDCVARRLRPRHKKT